MSVENWMFPARPNPVGMVCMRYCLHIIPDGIPPDVAAFFFYRHHVPPGQVSCTKPCRVKDVWVSASNFGTHESFSKHIKKHNLHPFRWNCFLFSKRQVTLQPNKIREQIGLTMTDIFSSRP
ncbi:MAG: hypothetical protein LBT76_06200, partial [Tannerella sp.]|nr:hypothetical protein [Tannerella sp.]